MRNCMAGHTIPVSEHAALINDYEHSGLTVSDVYPLTAATAPRIEPIDYYILNDIRNRKFNRIYG